MAPLSFNVLRFWDFWKIRLHGNPHKARKMTLIAQLLVIKTCVASSQITYTEFTIQNLD